MIKTNIKMRVTPEQSKRVQEICFENGINFLGNKEKIIEKKVTALFIRDSVLTCSYIKPCIHFNNHSFEEIDADLFIKTNGTCEESIRDKEQSYYKSAIQYYNNVVEKIMDKETYLTKYTSQPKNLESALKKIENLHIALKKKVDKNKNQALEITKLLEQKKDLQDKLNQANRVVKIGIDNSAELVNYLDKKDEIIREKETIILYLESKLK